MILQTSSATITEAAPAGYVEYEIDIERILRSDLPGILSNIPIAPLTSDSILRIPKSAKGAYVLYEDGHPVYAGKTDTRHGFRDRLAKHGGTIQYRKNINPDLIGFKAVRILVFSNFDVEAILINELREIEPSALRWNDSGFGSNDPGRNREPQEPAFWDVERPIDIDRPITSIDPGTHTVLGLLIGLKRGLPFDFRYQTDLNDKEKPKRYTVGHADHRNAPQVTIPEGETITVRSVLTAVLAALPADWRVTVFPGRLVLYAEDTPYRYALEYL